MVKKLNLVLAAMLLVFLTTNLAQAKEKTSDKSGAGDTLQLRELHFDTVGTITIGTGLARLEIPKGFKYLDAEQSKYVIHNLWGNPPTEQTLGMIFPDYTSDLVPTNWGIEITYDDQGHVKDDDAKDIKYDELLKQMQKEVEEVNPERKKQGYPTFQLTGWASPPYYDEKEKKLHWAKKILFEGDTIETLNYNIRILGRKGVLVLNAIGGMNKLDEIKSRVNPVLASVNFTEGNTYADYKPSVDKVAAYGIGGLIAGGVLLKTGLFSKLGLILLKFLKPILVGAAAVGGTIWRFITGRRKTE